MIKLQRNERTEAMVSANRDKSLLLLKIRGARSDRDTHTRMDARKNERTIAIP